jgi:hypothetical protein
MWMLTVTVTVSKVQGQRQMGRRVTDTDTCLSLCLQRSVTVAVRSPSEEANEYKQNSGGVVCCRLNPPFLVNLLKPSGNFTYRQV